MEFLEFLSLDIVLVGRVASDRGSYWWLAKSLLCVRRGQQMLPLKLWTNGQQTSEISLDFSR
jgi:hypothetical protein